jgi:hypothetical protein
VACKTGRRAQVDDTPAVRNRVQGQKIAGGGEMVERGKGASGKKNMRKTSRTVVELALLCPHLRRREKATGWPLC